MVASSNQILTTSAQWFRGVPAEYSQCDTSDPHPVRPLPLEKAHNARICSHRASNASRLIPEYFPFGYNLDPVYRLLSADSPVSPVAQSLSFRVCRIQITKSMHLLLLRVASVLIYPSYFFCSVQKYGMQATMRFIKLFPSRLLQPRAAATYAELFNFESILAGI